MKDGLGRDSGATRGSRESWCAWMRTEHIVQNGSVIMKTTIAYN